MENKTAQKIFIVDDEPYCLHLLEQYLTNLGYSQVFPINNSADCLNRLTEEPDIIFLDYNIDNVNGIDLLKKIKRFNPNIIVLFASSQEKIGIAVDALKYGALDYIIKEDMSEDRIKLNMEKALAIKDIIDKKNKKGLVRKILGGLNN